MVFTPTGFGGFHKLHGVGKDLKTHGCRAELMGSSNEISQLNNELSELRKLRSEYENVRSQAQHVDTFKSELLKARDEIKKLNEQIENLQLPPAKRKKIEDSKLKESTNEPVEDGGTF